MRCPRCDKLDTRVVDSRLTDNNRVIRRRRLCDACKSRFTTFERIELVHLAVIKKDDTREPYDREKLSRGIWTACRKRPVSPDTINDIISGLEEKWSSGKKEVSSIEIGEQVLAELRKHDPIAYIRFASVYQDFGTVDEFTEILEKMATKD